MSENVQTEQQDKYVQRHNFAHVSYVNTHTHTHTHISRAQTAQSSSRLRRAEIRNVTYIKGS